MRNQEPRTNKSDWSIRISYALIILTSLGSKAVIIFIDHIVSQPRTHTFRMLHKYIRI